MYRSLEVIESAENLVMVLNSLLDFPSPLKYFNKTGKGLIAKHR